MLKREPSCELERELFNSVIEKTPDYIKKLDYKFHTKLYNGYGGIDIHTLKNGWDIFYKLCEACYLCKNCSVKNRKSFEWSNDKKHTLSDWII